MFCMIACELASDGAIGQARREEQHHGALQLRRLTMGKRRTRERAATLTPAESRSGPTRGKVEKASVLSRGRRKRAAAKARLEQKRDFIERELELQQIVEKKGKPARKKQRAPGLSLSELVQALPEKLESAPEAVKRPRTKLNASTRGRIVAEETEQLQSVRENPIFKLNPVEALRQHLLNTVCATPSAVPPALSGDAPGAKKEKRTEQQGKGTARVEVGAKQLAAARKQAREVVKEKRARKAEMANAVARLAKRRGDKGVVKVPKGRRGRIGEKRPKILDED